MKIREAINLLKSMKEFYNDDRLDNYYRFELGDNEAIDKAIKILEQKAVKGKTIEPFTDTEQQLFLVAMSREEKLCKECDDYFDDDVKLVPVCNRIKRKVKKALWQ